MTKLKLLKLYFKNAEELELMLKIFKPFPYFQEIRFSIWKKSTQDSLY